MDKRIVNGWKYTARLARFLRRGLKMTLRNFLCMCVVLVCLAACSSQPKFDARTALPCEVYTRADATELLGQAVRETTMGNVPDLTESDFVSCAYLTAQAPPSGISFTLYGRKNSANGLKFYQTSLAESTAQNTITSVVGLGDEAFWNGTMLLVKRGNQVIGVTAARGISQNDLNMAKAVANKLLTRLR